MSIREDIVRPLSAYEELKAWCEKHLSDWRWRIVHYRTKEKAIILSTMGVQIGIFFDENGEYLRIDSRV